MGKGGCLANSKQTERNDNEYDWDEIKKHSSRDDRWIVIDNIIYDVTRWAKKHPGGEKVIHGYAGEDASEAWFAFHNDKELVRKYMKPLAVGVLKDDSIRLESQFALRRDFKKLRAEVEKRGLFKPDPLFFVLIVGHIVALDLLGWGVISYFGSGWSAYFLAALLLTTSQAQAGWSQHDFGHLSVFKSSRLNHWMQIFILNFMKGASSDWWNYRHLNHHAKPNVIKKDPDIRLDYIFLVGKIIPTEWGKKKKGHLPFHFQHKYFFFVLPPFLLPIYFNLEIPYFLIHRRKWQELFWMLTFFLRWYLMFGPLLGAFGTFKLYLLVRFFESHWFVWCTQMSHISMTVDYDKQQDWVSLQLAGTCNAHCSAFNDWFCGHLNLQIEHHLFPTMPRHNLHKAQPLVQELCQKHRLHYQNKPMLQAMADIVRSLKESGRLWLEAYEM